MQLFLVTAACIIITGCGGGNKLTYQPSETALLQTMVEKNLAAYKIGNPGLEGGTALHIITPNGSYFVSAGMGENVNEYCRLRTASTTKTFTAASIMLLYQNNLLDIDDKITDLIPGTTDPYVPDTADYDIPNKDDITIRLLLEHRAGVFDISNDPIPSDASAPYAGQSYISYVREVLGDDEHTFTFDELVGVVASNNLSYTAPDTEFHYSNTGYSILAKIIERVSGMRYNEYVIESFLSPNGLSSTSFPYLGSDQTLPSPFASGTTYVAGVSYETTLDNMSPHVGEGNVISTPRDLDLWVRRLVKGQAGVDATHAAMMNAVEATGEQHEYYGLGITYTPGLGYGHNGGHLGFMTAARYDPDTDVSFVVVSSFINGNDLYGNLDYLYDIARSARRILGHP